MLSFFYLGNARIKKTYRAKYKEEWKIKYKYNWLTQKNNNAYCTLCRKSIHCAITHIKRHAKSLHHIRKEKKIKGIPKITEATLEKTSLKRKVFVGELKLCMYLAEHNVPFLHLEHLPQLIKSICPDSLIAKEIKCSRTKGASIIREVLGAYSLQEISNILREQKFSLIIDETTDNTTKKSLALVVRYFYNERQAVKDRLLSLVELSGCTAQDIYNCIKDLFAKNNILFTNLIGK